MKHPLPITLTAVGLTASAAAQTPPWQDDFESYAPGTTLFNVNGWTGWTNNSLYAGVVTNSLAHSGANAMQVDPQNGGPVYVHSGFTSGAWTMSLWQYVPSALNNGRAIVIINNVYAHRGPKQWAVQIACDPFTGLVSDQFRPEANVINVAWDQWIQIRIEVDLDLDTVDTYYDGTLLSSGVYAINGGAVEIATLNLWTQRFTGSPAYYDDIVLDYTCYADCDASTGRGVLDIFDFLCFQNSFVSGEPYACECDPDPACNIFDFLCFQTAFVNGCP